MPKATNILGDLYNLTDCYVKIPGFGTVYLHILPDINDGKSAAYNDEPIMGRSFPLKTHSHSENRNITMQLHFMVRKPDDVAINLSYLRALESAVYPVDDGLANSTFEPPPICKIKCGQLLSNSELCVILKSYAVKFPTDVVWDENSYLPHKFDIDVSWEVVYKSSELPGQSRIIGQGS